jgi:hypothetical protein
VGNFIGKLSLTIIVYIASDYNPVASRDDKVFTILVVSKYQGIFLVAITLYYTIS